MRAKTGRAAIVVAAIVVAVAGLSACGSDEDETAGGATTAESTTQGDTTAGSGKQSAGNGQASVPIIVIRDGEPVGGVQELEYDAGEQVRFRVQSDVADEVHVHGYDLMKDVAAGGTVAFSFPADIEGIFEVELEERVEQIAELRVNP